MNARLLLVLAVGLLPAADKPKDEAIEKEVKALQGTWRIVAHQQNGEKAAENATGLGTIVFTKDEIRIKHPRDVVDLNPYQIRPGKDPKQIDVLFPDAMKTDARRLGIYSVERVGETDRLKICLAVCFDQERPKDFSIKRNNEVFVLERNNIWW